MRKGENQRTEQQINIFLFENGILVVVNEIAAVVKSNLYRNT